jgi:hypothetical protein
MKTLRYDTQPKLPDFPPPASQAPEEVWMLSRIERQKPPIGRNKIGRK